MITRANRRSLPVLLLALIALIAAPVALADMIKARDGSGVFGYKDTPALPTTQPGVQWVMHDPDRPLPPIVTVGPAGPTVPAPSDAVVLFDGGDLSAWQDSDWVVEAGQIVAGKGKLVSKATFGDVQVHVEFLVPAGFDGPWYAHGNNGVTLLDLYEIQIFDSHAYKIPLYADGHCAAIYGQTPPLANACRPPGEWQTFDITFIAPVYEGETLVKPARLTLYHNGVLVHHNQEIFGETRHRIRPEYKKKISTGPISLPAHYCPVRFRNVWARPLDLGSSSAVPSTQPATTTPPATTPPTTQPTSALDSIPDTVTDIDGNVYQTVTIGNQVWTVENLRTTKFNDGTPVPHVTDTEAWKALSTPGYCHYNNDPANSSKSGLLYNWYAASSDKLAPKGWRVPTLAEQLALRDYLIANGFNYDGTTEGNKVGKSLAAPTDWPYLDRDYYKNPAPDLVGMVGNKPETNNRTGFSARPAGSRWSDGSFHSLETSIYFWSVTPHDDAHARHTSLHTWFAKFGDNHHHKCTGFSIRLIRDESAR